MRENQRRTSRRRRRILLKAFSPISLSLIDPTSKLISVRSRAYDGPGRVIRAQLRDSYEITKIRSNY